MESKMQKYEELNIEIIDALNDIISTSANGTDTPFDGEDDELGAGWATG